MLIGRSHEKSETDVIIDDTPNTPTEREMRNSERERESELAPCEAVLFFFVRWQHTNPTFAGRTGEVLEDVCFFANFSIHRNLRREKALIYLAHRLSGQDRDGFPVLLLTGSPVPLTEPNRAACGRFR